MLSVLEAASDPSSDNLDRCTVLFDCQSTYSHIDTSTIVQTNSKYSQILSNERHMQICTYKNIMKTCQSILHYISLRQIQVYSALHFIETNPVTWMSMVLQLV